MDQTFLDRFTEVVESNLSHDDFGVEDLAREIGLSRSQLHRKLSALTGYSPSEFLKNRRLKKAKELLEAGKGNVSEVAYQVGFSSPSYFNTAFHEHFGYSPGKTKEAKSNIGEQKGFSISKKSTIILLVSVILVGIGLLSYNYGYRKNVISGRNPIADKSIAVLPFKNLSDDQANQYFTDGQMDAILNHLSKIKDLRVISRTTMDQFRNSDKTIPEIAKGLGVRYVLEGSVQKSGNQVRIIVQLIDGTFDTHIWSDHYDRDLSNIFSVQSEIAKNIAWEMKSTLTYSEQIVIESVPTKDLNAYDFYLKGMEYTNRTTGEGYSKFATQMFEKVVEIDPQYTLAWVGLASQARTKYWWHHDRSDEHLKSTKRYLENAIKRDPSRQEVRIESAFQKYHIEQDHSEALNMLKSIIDDYPHNDLAYRIKGAVLRRLGKFDQSTNSYEYARTLDPMHWISWLNMAINLEYLHEFPRAISYAQTAVELNPSSESGYYRLSTIYCEMGRVDLAKELLQSNSEITSYRLITNRINTELFELNFKGALEIMNESYPQLFYSQYEYTPKSLALALVYYMMSEPNKSRPLFLQASAILQDSLNRFENDSRIYSSLGIAYAGLGLKSEAMEAGKKAQELMNRDVDYMRGFRRELDMAKIHMMVGNFGQAIDQLEQLVANPGPLTVELLKIDPFWDPVKGSEAFESLVENPKYQVKIDLSN